MLRRFHRHFAGIRSNRYGRDERRRRLGTAAGTNSAAGVIVELGTIASANNTTFAPTLKFEPFSSAPGFATINLPPRTVVPPLKVLSVPRDNRPAAAAPSVAAPPTRQARR